MKRPLSTLLALGLCLGTVSAQNDAAAAAVAVEASLTPELAVVRADSTILLRLSIRVLRPAALDATALAGVRLRTTVEGKPGPAIEEIVAGKVKVAADTEIRRVLRVPVARVVPVPSPTGLTHVTFAWPDLVGATAALQVAPKVAAEDLERLDLARTRVMLVTGFGNIVIGFRPDKAPNHVKNFVKLAQSGFYDGTKFHRIIPGFMVQGGCPNTKEGATGQPGTGGPGYTIDAEFNDIKHVRGVVSMARTSDPNSAGSQFFIMHGDAPHLDGQYTAFGKVEEGMDVVDRIAAVPLTRGPTGEISAPLEPVILYAAVVLPAFRK